jgi:hypothetical protein
VNRLDQETAKRRGPTRAVEPFKKTKKKKMKKKKKADYLNKKNYCRCF